MSLKINELYKHFDLRGGRKAVLEGLDLQVEPGEIFALSGANGSGKTTLLKIIAALVLPTSGSVFSGGINVVDFPREARTGLVCDADSSFYRMLSVEENIRFFARLYGRPVDSAEKRTALLFDELGLNAHRKTTFAHLSSGMKQRLALARALLSEPRVLLIDEVSRSLDEESAANISSYIRNAVSKSDAACVAVTHDSSWAGKYADRAGVLVNGTIELIQ